MAQTRKKTAAEILGLPFPEEEKSPVQIAGENEAMAADYVTPDPEFHAEMQAQQAAADSAFAAPIERDRIIQKSKNELPTHIDKPAPHINEGMEEQKARDEKWEKEYKRMLDSGEIMSRNEFNESRKKQLSSFLNNEISKMTYLIQQSEKEQEMTFADYAALMPGQLKFKKNEENY